jgi:hypothetical protein
MHVKKTTRTSKVATMVALAGVLLMSSGFALMAGVGPAGAADGTDCTPRAAWTETVDHPAVTHTERVMTDPGSPAVDPVPAVPGVWANWAPSNTQGPQDYTPVWPTDARGKWVVHDDVPPGHAGPDGVYQQGGGNSPFFYRKAGTPAIPGKAAVAPTFEDKVVVDKKAWTEEIDHPAVTCEVEATVTVDPPACENSGVGSWSITGEHLTFSPQASGTGGPGSVVVEATAATGYVFDNGTDTKSYTVELPAYTAPDGFAIDPDSGACVAVDGPQTVEPGPVSFAADCDPFGVTLPGGTVVTEAGTTEVDGVAYAVTGDLAAGGTVTVKAAPTGDQVLTEGAQTEWTHTFATEEQCTIVAPPETVEPGRVGFAADCDPFGVTLPGGTVVTEAGTTEVDGVAYAVTGDLAAGGTVTVKAAPTGDQVLTDGAQTEWTHTFATEEQCTVVEPPVVGPPVVDPPTGDPADGTSTAGLTTSGTTAVVAGPLAPGATTSPGTTVPTAVHAGLGSVGSASPNAPAGGLALTISGLLMLVGAAAMVWRRNARAVA